jgi:tetratricopeptide (TPR) repeat protein
MSKIILFLLFFVNLYAEEVQITNPVLDSDKPDDVKVKTITKKRLLEVLDSDKPDDVKVENDKNSSDNTINTTKTLEKNLLYSQDIIENNSNDIIDIKKGGWDVKDTEKFEAVTASKINLKKEDRKIDKDIILAKNKAYIALQEKQYEVAIHYYKQILEKNGKDVYAKLGLATTYQYLDEYDQAKPYYMDILKSYPEDQQIIANVLSILIEETPYESVFLVSNIANKYPDSPIIQAQASNAQTKVKNFPMAIEYIKKAIVLDDSNIEYRYNLATLYDFNENYKLAVDYYRDVLKYSNFQSDTNFILPTSKIEERINYIVKKKL